MIFLVAGFLAVMASGARAEANVWSAYAHEMPQHLLMTWFSPFSLSTHVCYKDLGCFYKKNGTFQHVRMLPDMVDTFFVIYTRNSTRTLWFKNDEDMITAPELVDPDKPIKVIIHGYGGEYNLEWVQKMKNAFLRREDVTVVTVDWSRGTQAPYYYQSAVNSELVGRQVARFLMAMPVPEKSIHVIGFSLGAQTAGFAGEYFAQERGKKIGRITALDAASPLFEHHGDGVHVDKNDALLVDTIHTSVESFLKGGLGMEIPYGHVDFYPNGGKVQPGCDNLVAGGIKDLFTKKRDHACNHERAVHLFIETISGCRFRGFRCSDNDYRPEQCSLQMADGVMGYDTKGDGVYFTTTAQEEPYCVTQYEVEVLPSEVTKTRGSLTLMLRDSGGKEELILLTNSNNYIRGGQVIKAIVGSRMSPDNLTTAGLLYKKFFLSYVAWWHTDVFVDKITLRHPESIWIENCHKNTKLVSGEMLEIINSPCNN